MSSTEQQRSHPQDERLTEREQRQIARLLSDPSYFPVEFRTWMKNYLEGSGLKLPYSQIIGRPAAGARSLPPGLILEVARPTRIPAGTVRCDHAELSRETFPALFEEIGTEFGAGDGSTTFNVPNRPRHVITTGRRA